MKKLKQFWKNIMWLCSTDLKKEWENRHTATITGKELASANRIKAVIKPRQDFQFVDTSKGATINRP